MKINRLLGALLIIALSSCGGGSRGTGDLDIEGKAFTSSGLPIQNATVTFSATGDSGLTDSNGRFSIMTQAVNASAEFVIDSNGVSIISSGGTLTDDVQEIEVEIKVEIENGKPARASQTVTVKKKRDDNNESSGGSSGSGGDDNNKPDDGNGSGSDDGQGGSDSDDDSGDDGDDDNSGSGGSDDGSGSDDEDDNSGSDDDGDDNQGGSGGSDDGSDNDDDSGISNPDDGSGDNDDKQETKVETSGLISALTANSITVNGKTFTVNSSTDFDKRNSLSDFKVGESVEIKGEIVGGVLMANEIKFKD